MNMINKNNNKFSLEDKNLLEVINASYLTIEDINWLKSKWWFKRFLKVYSKELKKRYKNKDIIDKNKLKIKDEDIEILDFTQSIKIPSKEVIEILDFTKTLDITDVKDITLATNNAKRKVKIEKAIWSIIVLFSILTAIIFSIILLNSYIENRRTKKIVNKIYEMADIKEIKINENEEQEILDDEVENNDISTTENSYIPTLYDTYGSMNMLEVNFTNLLNVNSDTKGWIKVNGTKINYPFVQTTDNNYYLKHSFDKSNNKKGWVYMDYRNSIDNLNDNTILYAHGLVNNQMFGSMRKILKSSWYNNKENHIIKVSTLTNNQLWQVFSIYTIEPESYYITTNFNNKDAFNNFIEVIKSRSIYNFGLEVTNNDKILTLSSCYNDKKRMVMHAKLLENQIR